MNNKKFMTRGRSDAFGNEEDYWCNYITLFYPMDENKHKLRKSNENLRIKLLKKLHYQNLNIEKIKK